jgi:hypothetical protein
VNLWPAELERNVNRIEPLLSRNLQTVTPVTTVTCGTPDARPSTPCSVTASAARRLVSVWSKVPLCRILQVHVEVAMDEFRPELLVALGDEGGTGQSTGRCLEPANQGSLCAWCMWSIPRAVWPGRTTCC